MKSSPYSDDNSYREQTSGYQWGSGDRGKIGAGD